MLRRNLAIAAILLTSCGKPPVQSAEVVPYLQAFNEQYSGLNVDAFKLDVELVDQLDGVSDESASHTPGECMPYNSHKIELSRSLWDKMSDTMRKSLVFHELGHCVFNRVHLDTKYSDGCPTTLMSTNLIPDGCVAAHHDDLFSELPHTP